MAIDLGDLVPLTVTIQDPAGAPTNAATVVLTITLPDGTTVTPAVANPPTSTGVYAVDYPTGTPGRHVVRWLSTGPAAAYVDTFDVRSADIPYIVSLADMKEQLKITKSDWDEPLRRDIEAATGVIERHLGQAVVRRTRTEEHNVATVLVLNWAPVVSLVSLTAIDGQGTWNASDFHCSEAGVVRPIGSGTNQLHGRISTTYIAGRSIIPAEYCEAAEIIIQQLWETRRGGGGAPRPGGMADSMGGISRTTSYGYAIPNRALELLGTGMPGIA